MQILCQCFYESFWKLLLHLTPAKDSLVSKSHLEFTHLLFLQPPFREGQPGDTMGTNCQEFSCTTLRGKYLLMEIKKQVAAGFEKPGICAFLSHLWPIAVPSEHTLTFPAEEVIGGSSYTLVTYFQKISRNLETLSSCQPLLKSVQVPKLPKADLFPNCCRVRFPKTSVNMLKYYQQTRLSQEPEQSLKKKKRRKKTPHFLPAHSQ